MVYILDASALLAYLTREDKHEKVADLFAQALVKNRPLFISAVNWAETAFKIQQYTGEAYWCQLKDQLKSHPLHIVEITQGIAEEAAYLKFHYKLGLADAMAAALVKQQHAVLVTKDSDFRILEKTINILWI